MILFHNAINIGKGGCGEPDDGDELASDSFPYEIIDGVCYKFKLQNRTDKSCDNFDIGANASAEEAAEETESSETSGIDCVLNHNLQEMPGISKKLQFKEYIRTYGKALKPLLEKKYSDPEVGKDRIAKLGKVYMGLLKDFDNLSFFCGASYNLEATVLIVQWDGTQPYGFLPVDGVSEEKL